MNKQELLLKVQLYVIADKKICGDKNIEEVVSRAIDGGAEMIQYRDKESDYDDFLKIASKLKTLCKEKDIPFIVNDRVTVALKTDADGVHLGQEDLSIQEARGILGFEKIIGKSAKTIQQAKEAEDDGADYVGVGPIFDTPSKQIEKPIGVEIIRKAKDSLKIPFFPIGGINLNNLDQIIRAGGKRVAVISAVVLSDDVKSSAAKLLERLQYQDLT
ncbi:MAG: thiamine phosphate synthase [candidate division Zixibacteria bacterium]|nr:thiamine phosphate synthase [candidate division Zixibacteria bacterium]